LIKENKFSKTYGNKIFSLLVDVI
jgi:hypothetical protein